MGVVEALLFVLFYGGVSGLVFLPGFALISALEARRKLESGMAVMIAVLCSAALGYAAFWIYFFSKTAGQSFSCAVLLTSTVAVTYFNWRRENVRGILRRTALPFAYAALWGLFCCSVLFAFANPFHVGVDLANTRFFADVRPGDNLIPLFLAERIYDRLPIKPFCCGDWLSSDRPPLQAGVFLLERPLRFMGNTGLQYQVLGSVLQSLWVCGVWVLLHRARPPKKVATKLIVLLGFSPFFLYNSVYVWPKLLAATFVLFLYAIFLDDRKEMPFTWTELLCAVTALSLAMMAHPGSVFSLPGLAVLGRSRFKYIGLKRTVVIVFLIAAALCPWMAYQKYYDPPGNRLAKMHLAGVSEVDGRSTGEAVEEEYRKLTPFQIWRNKWSNVERLLGPSPTSWLPPFSGATRSELTRVAQREYMWDALGVINIGWIAMLLGRWRRSIITSLYARLIGAAVVNVVVWCVVMFGPAQTVVTHSSYADLLLLYVGLGGCLVTMWPRVSLFVVILEVINLTWLWAANRPAFVPVANGEHVTGHAEHSMIVLATASGLVLFWLWLRAGRDAASA